MKEVLKLILQWIIRLSPKKNFCYLKAYPSYEDSVLAIYNKLDLSKVSKVIWSVYDLESEDFPVEVRENTIFVQKGSLKDFYYGVISKYIFTTHGHIVPKIPSNQTCVNMWHGMPLKAIGKLDGQPSRQDTYLCSTSDLFRDLMARAFEMPLDRTKITGIPRNDHLVNNEPESIWKKAGINRSKYDKVFFWLPTYRKSVVGYLTEDGVEVDNIFNMRDFSVVDFQRYLEEINCLCIIKPHPMAPIKDYVECDNILTIDEKWMWSKKLSLYSLLGQTDFLVSDISSVIIDYMLLDKPIIISFQDFNEYEQSRNVVFDSIEDWLPGEFVKGVDSLKEEITRCCNGIDTYKEKRHRLTEMFHKDRDFKSTERVLGLVWK